MIERLGRALAVFAMAAGTMATGPMAAPVGAELTSEPTTAWGVSGLRTGTQSDSIESPVFAMARIGNVLFVGGRFTDVTDGATTTPRADLAAFDATTGEWLPGFAPALNGAVYALAASPDGSRLFVGGDFTTVNGTSTGALIALDPSTGAIDSAWTGRVGGYQLVRDLAVDGTDLYVAGGFTSISSSAGGNAANKIARFDTSTGVQDSSWRPTLAGGSVWGVDVSPGAGRVYAAGTFKTSNGASVTGGFVSLDITTAANTPGVEPLQVNTVNAWQQYSYDVLATNGKVFVAGSQHSLQVLDEPDLSLDTFHLSKYRGDYQDLTLVGNRVYASCHCGQETTLASADGVMWVGSPPAGQGDATPFANSPNSWVGAFDATTGAHIPSFRPDVEAGSDGLWASVDDGNGCLWFGGELTSTAGTPQFGMTRLCEGVVVVPDTSRPSPPGQATVESIGADSVDLAWGVSSDDVGVAGYRVIDVSNDAVVLEIDALEGTVTGLAPGDYRFMMKAFDAAGNQSWRSGYTDVTITGAAIDVQRPSPPRALIVTSNADGIVSFGWDASTDDIGVVGYHLTDSDTDSIVASSPTTTLDLSGQTGTHSFHVRAYDAAGNISWRSNIVTVTVLDGPAPDTQRPTVPTSPVVVGSAPGSVDLTWTGSTDDVGVAGYRIFDAADNSVLLDTPDTDGTISGLAPGTYSIYAKAYDAAGNQSWRSGFRQITIS